jgi:hypothetical protein
VKEKLIQIIAWLEAQSKPLGAKEGCIFVKSESWEKVGEIVAWVTSGVMGEHGMLQRL